MDSKTIRVIEHTGPAKVAPAWTFRAYPFDSVGIMKQHIALHYGDRAHMSAGLFMATKTAEGLYKPLEFRWPFATAMADPLDPEVYGKPSTDLMEGDVRKPVFPTILAGVTLEDLGNTQTEIHIWSLATVMRGFTTTVTPTLVAGFLQLYFPLLETAADAEAVADTVTPLTETEEESLETARLFQEARQARLVKLEGFLTTPSTNPIRLHELRALRIFLPAQDLREPLDILFHTMTPTRQMPILRFFSANQRTPPLLKLALSPAGIPLLADAKLLKVLLADAPAAEQGSLIVGKAPLMHPKAPFGAAWMLRIHEDGSGEAVLGAPRRDAPLGHDVVHEAMQQLRSLLETTPWKDVDVATTGRLDEFTGTYKYTLQQDIRKPSKAELRKRADPFLPLFKEEGSHTGEAAAVNLRWKAVSNYEKERDPIMSYIADLFLKESLQSVEAIPVAAYIGAITREFGLGPTEAGAALTTWINRHAEYVLLDSEAPEKAVAKYGTGAAVALYNHHPDYLFTLAGTNSYTDLIRILSMLEIWVSHTSQELSMTTTTTNTLGGPGIPPMPEEAPLAEEPTMGNVGQMDDWMQTMEMYGTFDPTYMEQFGTEPEPLQDLQPAPETEPEPAPAPVLGIETDVRFPEPISADEPPLPPLDKFLIQRLQNHDSELFSYKTEQSTKLFSRTCQSSSNKQPNVMSPEAYRRVRSLYGDSVHWVEAPLSTYDRTAVYFTSKVLGERIKEAKAQKKTLEDLLEMEKRVLRLGIPLKDGKDGKSVVDKMKDAPAGAKEEIAELLKYQDSKPLWLVVRAGTGRANYYICAEFWCIRDDLPIIDKEFTGKISRRGQAKPANTCPFCGGREIPRDQVPKAGETVLRRGNTTKAATGVVARYAGFGTELYHPKGFVVPCCFTDPGNVIPPEESAPFPAPIVDLPPIQQEGPKTPKKAEAVDVIAVRNLMDVFHSIRIKLDAKEVEGVAEGTKVEVAARAIVRAYILAATSFPLELGKVGLVSEAVDAFLGQDHKQYLESPKHGKIYTHPKLRGKAFFRLGLGTKLRNIGNMILQLIAFAGAAVSQNVPPFQAVALSPEQVVTDLLETREAEMFRAFQQANYGTLPAEFADPENRPTAGVLQEWCGRMGIPLPAQRAHAAFLYGAWSRFRAYMADATQRKELRLWEHLFAAPGLFSTTGVILAVITTDENDHVRIRCPSLGIAPRFQSTSAQPPVLFLYEDRRTQIVEPLIFYEGPDNLLGVVDPSLPDFSKLSAPVQSALRSFYADYFDTTTGCARPAPVEYPWAAEKPQGGIPRLGGLITILQKPANENMTIRNIVRDRTRRVVGLAVTVGALAVFLPAVDDGTIDISLPSQYDVEALPLSPLVPLLNVLASLSKDFLGFTPVALRSQARGGTTMLVALETKAGCLIPLEPVKADAVIAHPLAASLRGSVHIDFLPWEEDGLAAFGETTGDTLHNPEEALEEAYQHVRLSLHEWLATAAGTPYKRAIESLRESRIRLPLFELRRRMDLLLAPVVTQWISVKADANREIATLRRNCLKLPAGKCHGACAWSAESNTCLIHAAPTERFVDPAFVIVARLVDELLRTNEPALQVLQKGVARLRPPVGVVREGDSVLMSFEGRGDAAVFKALGLEGRRPSRYTQGLVIPEEMGAQDVGCEGTNAGIPLTWEGIVPYVGPAKGTGQVISENIWAGILGNLYSKALWDSLHEIWRTRGEWAFYEEVVGNTDFTILFTRDSCHGFELIGRLTPPSQNRTEERRFIILTPNKLPLMSEKSKKPFLVESELPSVILAWLDESPKNTREVREELLEILEEEKGGTTPMQPYQAIEEEERRVKEEQRKKAPAAVVAPAVAKPCPENQERSAISGRCVKKCEAGKVRNEKGICVKTRAQQPRIVIAEEEGVVEEELSSQELRARYNARFNELNKMTMNAILVLVRGRGYTGHSGYLKGELIDLVLREEAKAGAQPQPQPQPQQPQTQQQTEYDKSKCETSKGKAKAFPFKKEDVTEALREQGVHVPKSWTMKKICDKVTNETITILVRHKTRRNRNRNNK